MSTSHLNKYRVFNVFVLLDRQYFYKSSEFHKAIYDWLLRIKKAARSGAVMELLVRDT